MDYKAKREIDLHGLIASEAEVILDSCVKEAIAVGYNELVVVHGASGGVLRDMVIKYSEKSPYVEKRKMGGVFHSYDAVSTLTLKNKNLNGDR